ncbi:alpha-amlyase [Thermoplasma sp. Kam2015]|uniref:glycoside hydrolase family 57 protein n=1 Tax=Thermoplasma sp. Kam2015 TaxID=2094122 RepID=UPI000D96DC72|nr:glycoside hydrolase family 57 protein [Thermoplasma sp. Kam2015]PYB68642.1 alpha-amlyase [Thermoplasma sp. Kam2015]
MKDVMFYFELHQPFRLRPINLTDLRGGTRDIFWDEKNEEIFKRIAVNNYIPATQHLMEYGIRSSFSLSGTFMEQASRYCPKVIDVIEDYVKSGLCELMAETYYHSLASIWNDEEFTRQVSMQTRSLKNVFNYDPVSFRNTELIYNDHIAEMAKKMGFRNILAEGTDGISSRYNVNHRYAAPSGINLYLRNYPLSDDISFRFSNRSWKDYPLTADKFARWISLADGDLINLFMDYETFGEHQRPETGIFEFLKHLPRYFQEYGIDTILVREAELRHRTRDFISIEKTTSWADKNRDLSAWMGNLMQVSTFDRIRECKDKLGDLWGYFQTSDVIYYMSIGDEQDFTVHEYFNPYRSPYLAFIYTNAALDILCGKDYGKNVMQ